jgi:hypothetical protein
MPDGGLSPCVIRVLGVGGGGCNAVRTLSTCFLLVVVLISCRFCDNKVCYGMVCIQCIYPMICTMLLLWLTMRSIDDEAVVLHTAGYHAACQTRTVAP